MGEQLPLCPSIVLVKVALLTFEALLTQKLIEEEKSALLASSKASTRPLGQEKLRDDGNCSSLRRP